MNLKDVACGTRWGYACTWGGFPCGSYPNLSTVWQWLIDELDDARRGSASRWRLQ